MRQGARDARQNPGMGGKADPSTALQVWDTLGGRLS